MRNRPYEYSTHFRYSQSASASDTFVVFSVQAGMLLQSLKRACSKISSKAYFAMESISFQLIAGGILQRLGLNFT